MHCDRHTLLERIAVAFRLVALDMDGTLLTPEGNIPPEFPELAHELIGKGVKIVPASGRQLATLRAQFEGITDSFIAENGAVVAAGGRIIATHTIPVEYTQRLLKSVEDIDNPNFGFVLCHPSTAYVTRSDEEFLAECSKYYRSLELAPELSRYATDEVIKIAVYDFESAENNTTPLMSEILPELTVVTSGQHWTDIMTPGVHKGIAVADLCNALGLAKEQVLAFGDYLNDYELLAAAGTSYAMENAHPEVKEIATNIAPSNADNGVVTVLRKLLEEGEL